MKRSFHWSVAVIVSLASGLLLLCVLLFQVYTPVSYAADRTPVPTDTDPAATDTDKTDQLPAESQNADPEPPMETTRPLPQISLKSLLQVRDAVQAYVDEQGIGSSSVKESPQETEAPRTSGSGAVIFLSPDVQTEETVTFETENGKLVCRREDGTLVTGAIGTFLFDENGHYTTGDADLDAKISSVVSENTTDKMEPLDKLYALYQFMLWKCSYRMGDLHEVGEEGWEVEDARKMIDKNFRGNCYGYAALFRELARAVGFPAEAYSGMVESTEGGLTAHGWVEIPMDGRRYLFDPEIQHFSEKDMYMKDVKDSSTTSWGYTTDPDVIANHSKK